MSAFSSAGNVRGAIFVNLNWGVKDLDRSSVGLWDGAEIGSIVWDDEFTVAPAENQQALMDLCVDLRDQSALVKENFVKCWILDMDDFVRKDSRSLKQLPLTDEGEFNAYLKMFV